MKFKKIIICCFVSAVLNAEAANQFTSLLFMPSDEDFSTDIGFIYSSYSNFTSTEKYLSNSRIASGTDVEDFQYTSTELEADISFGVSEVLELGLHQGIVLTRTRQHLASESLSTLGENQEAQGIKDPELYGRYRFLEKDHGDSIADFVFTASPALISAEEDSDLSEPLTGNVGRGGSQFKFQLDFGHQKSYLGVLLGFYYGVNTTQQRTDLDDSTIDTTSSHSLFGAHFLTQYFYNDEFVVDFNIRYENTGDRDFTDTSSSLTYELDSYGRFDIELGPKIILSKESFIINTFIGYFYQNGYDGYYDGLLQFSNSGLEGLKFGAGLSILL
jgi:hypothetical protein